MSEFRGFGDPPQRPDREEKVQKRQKQRQQAASRYDRMVKQGLPSFNIFVRPEPDSPWLPVGTLAVNRSDKINAAIFQQEKELTAGALRLFPKLRSHADRLEYGYQLKEFPDEEIRVAVRPQPTLWDTLRQRWRAWRSASQSATQSRDK